MALPKVLANSSPNLRVKNESNDSSVIPDGRFGRRNDSRRTAGKRILLRGDVKREDTDEGMSSRPDEPGMWRKRFLAAGEVLGVTIRHELRSSRFI